MRPAHCPWPFDDDGGKNSGAGYVLFLNGQKEFSISMIDVVLKLFEKSIANSITQSFEVLSANLNLRSESMSLADLVLKEFSKNTFESLTMESEGFNDGTNKKISEGFSISELVLKTLDKSISESLGIISNFIGVEESQSIETAEFVMEDSVYVVKHPENFRPIFVPNLRITT